MAYSLADQPRGFPDGIPPGGSDNGHNLPAVDQETMKREFKVGDRVSWNSEAGRVRGTIQKKVTAPTRFKTYTARASKEEPQYLVKSEKTGHLAMHKGTALRKIGASRQTSQKGTGRSQTK